MESVFIAIGLISIISVLNVNDAMVRGQGGEATALAVARRHSRVDLRVGIPVRAGTRCAFGNGLMLGYLMYRSGLMPRRMAMLGLIGGPLLFISSC